MTETSRRALAVLSCMCLAAAAARAQPPRGTSREAMWPAPTAADWKKPVLIRFQRTWTDALAVSKETGKPILICVNMDGEIASEHYAGIRYREPEKAKLYEPYVCVIASVYRHTPRDFDEHGNRIPCPRFGSVTCGEHIRIEPILYAKFFDGKRIAPRHIMVELDGKESYDVYYAFDTESVFKAIDDGIKNRKIQPRAVVRGDRTIIERVASRDNVDRSAVEKAYREGDRELRRRLLEAARKHPGAAPNDLLRLAVFGLDTELSKAARKALAEVTSTGAIDVINEALRVPMTEAERKSLVSALARLGKTSRRARTLATVHGGLSSRKASVDVASWSKQLAGATYPAPTDRQALESRLADSDLVLQKRPEDADAQLMRAEASLALAIDPTTRARRPVGKRMVASYARLMFEDARNAAREAEKLGAKGWRVDSTLAIAAKHLGNRKEAWARAEAAVRAMPRDAKSWQAMATLELFAEARQRAIIANWRQKKDLPPEWLTDVHSTYAILAKHPLGTDRHFVSHYDFLVWLGAKRQARQCLEAGLERFPDSWLLHDRLRSRVLRDKGVAGLEPAYAAMLEAPGASPNLEWFAGYTSIVTAEYRRRRGRNAEADAAYDRAIAHYEAWIEAHMESRTTADHYVALALAGKARLAYERGDDARALADLLASFERKPTAAATLDGLNLTAVDTAKMLRARFKLGKRDAEAAMVQSALDALPPAMLEPPAYERPARGTRGRGRRRRRGR